jgi:hypothetical protein
MASLNIQPASFHGEWNYTIAQGNRVNEYVTNG